MKASNIVVVAVLLFIQAAKAQDLISCSPAEADVKPIAICAAAAGGCAAAESLASSAERGFLQGQMCEAMVARLTGGNYGIEEFLGSAIISGLDSASRDADKEGNSFAAIGWKLLAAAGRTYQFKNCVESARATCSANWRSSTTAIADSNGNLIRQTIETYYDAMSNGNARVAA